MEQVTLQSNYYAIISCYYVLEIEGQLLEFSGPNYDGASIFKDTVQLHTYCSQLSATCVAILLSITQQGRGKQ